MSSEEQPLLLEKQGTVAIITINREKKLGALSSDLYYELGQLLLKIAAMDDIFVTLIIGKGRFFSAGADFKSRGDVIEEDIHRHFMRTFTVNNLEVTRAFYNHPKILISALNGPVVGLTAALVGISDFIYATDKTYLLTPFSSLGLVAEGGASFAFVQRMGIAKANEALITSRRIPSDELVACGFVNKIFPFEDFRERVLAHVKDQFGDHLNQDSMIKIKKLIRAPYMSTFDKQNVDEVFGGAARFEAGLPQAEFQKLATGQKKHKL